MVLAKDIEPTSAAKPVDITLPPTNLYSNEPPLESDLHLRQILLLLVSLEWLWQDRTDFFASGNLTVYFSPKQIKSQDFRGPDFFLVLDTEQRSRKSWTVWEEDGKYPNLIVEILSDSTAKVDRTTKKKLYQNTFRTPEYFWFDPNTLEFAGFVLVAGEYETIPANNAGHLWSRQLNLHLGIHETKLRFFTAADVLVPTPEEAAREAQQKAARLAERLRSLGVDPDTV